MKCIRSAIALVFLLFVGTCSADDFLPSLNYWELSLQLLSDEKFRQAMEVSPYQAAAIRQMRSSEEFSELIRQNMVGLMQSHSILRGPDGKIDVRANAAALDKQGNFHDRIFESVNAEVKTKLEEILTVEQIQALRPFALRSRFTTGYSPFLSQEVLRFCEVTNSEEGPLRNEAMLAATAYEQSVLEARKQAAASIIGTLAPQSLQRFVQYVGNSLTPSLRVDTNLDFRNIPFRPLGQLPVVLELTQLQKACAISETQREQLSEIVKVFWIEMKQTDKTRTRKEIASEANKKMVSSAYKILKNGQVLYLLRHFAFEDFLRDVSSPFARPELNEYLQLNDQELTEIRLLASEEVLSLRKRIQALDQEVFDDLTGKLLPAAKQKMVGLFVDVWNRDY